MDARGNIYQAENIPQEDSDRLKAFLRTEHAERLEVKVRGIERREYERMTGEWPHDEKRTPVLYLDIDGTVRWGKDELGRFVNGPADVRVFDGVPQLLASYKALGWRIVGVSNQGGIALGIMSMQECARAMMETQRQAGDTFDKIAWCSHHPNAKDPEMAVCWCRKPRAGLVIEAALNMADRYRGEIYPPHLGLFVGDRPEDADCAAAAGLSFMAASEWRSGAHTPPQ
jgi:D-glycero-D-manno-heptose 1,7-bisphosphate phosphatase